MNAPVVQCIKYDENGEKVQKYLWDDFSMTPENILHKTVKRNEHFANLCYALRLMEREGSGYDKMYEIQLTNGKQIPRVLEGSDYVTAIVERRIISKEAIKVIRGALQIADLKQKQIICLGLIAQHESISAANLIKILNLKDRDALSPWLDPLLEYNIVQSVGSHRAKEYRISAPVLKQSDYKGKTSLKRIEDYRIKELISEDLKIYTCAPLKDIHQRIGKEIPYKKVLAQMKLLVSENIIEEIGANRWIQYRLIQKT